MAVGTLVLAAPATALLALEVFIAATIGDVRHRPALHHRLALWAQWAMVLDLLTAGLAVVLLSLQRTFTFRLRRRRRILLALLVVLLLAAGYARWQFEALGAQYSAAG